MFDLRCLCRFRGVVRGACLVAVVLSIRGLAEAGPSRSSLVVAGRTLAQDQGAWIIDYRLRHAGSIPMVIDPEDLSLTVDAWVSNSRVPSHAVPRRSTLEITRGPGRMAVCEVIAASDEEHRCREKLIAQLSVVHHPSAAGDTETWPPSGRGTKEKKSEAKDRRQRSEPVTLEPGDLVRLRLRLEHHHVIFGNYDPLLGARAIEIVLGGTTIRDVVAIDREHYLALPKYRWPEPPEERRDPDHFVSGPDSLHLEAHVPGHHYYRYPDRPVRYGTPMRLRFSYLIAAGTEGDCRFRIAQYKDTPTSWRMLNESGFEQTLTTVGRWTRVERVFKTADDATTLALDFRIAGDAEIGEMWIDNVSLEPVGCPSQPGP